MAMTEPTRIRCVNCRHYYITWDPNFPRGCRAFGFKSRQMPSDAVFRASGEPCRMFEPKTEPPLRPRFM